MTKSFGSWPLRFSDSPFLRFVGLWLPVVIWCGVIFYLSNQPYLKITEAWWDWIARKSAHMGEYAILARLLARALTGSTFWPWRKIFCVSLVLAILYAGTDEYHQTFIAGREGRAQDVAIDSLGAWLGLGFFP